MSETPSPSSEEQNTTPQEPSFVIYWKNVGYLAAYAAIIGLAAFAMDPRTSIKKKDVQAEVKKDKELAK